MLAKHESMASVNLVLVSQLCHCVSTTPTPGLVVGMLSTLALTETEFSVKLVSLLLQFLPTTCACVRMQLQLILLVPMIVVLG